MAELCGSGNPNNSCVEPCCQQQRGCWSSREQPGWAMSRRHLGSPKRLARLGPALPSPSAALKRSDRGRRGSQEGSGPFALLSAILSAANCQLLLPELMFFLSPHHIFLWFVLQTELPPSPFVFCIALFGGFALKGIKQ